MEGKKITIDDLAIMINKGFEATASDINELKDDVNHLKGDVNQLKGTMNKFEEKLDYTDARIARIESDISEMKGNIVYKYEFEDLAARVKYLETKFGIESGK